ncbi:MAG: 2-hydroxyacyl-CoA dehydratase family protein, partial [Synergistaceae bacterium]
MFSADFVIIANHIGCRNSMGMSGITHETARERDIPLCIFNYELMDSRVCSRQGIRNQISEFMMNVMHAEPLDASLLKIEDSESW